MYEFFPLLRLPSRRDSADWASLCVGPAIVVRHEDETQTYHCRHCGWQFADAFARLWDSRHGLGDGAGFCHAGEGWSFGSTGAGDRYWGDVNDYGGGVLSVSGGGAAFDTFDRVLFSAEGGESAAGAGGLMNIRFSTISKTLRRGPAVLKEMLGLLITGVLFLGIAFALWFALLAAGCVQNIFEISRHTHQSGYHSFSFFGSKLGLASLYGAVFFLSAFLVARLRWSFRPGLSTFLAYGIFLAIYLPGLPSREGSTFGIVSLYIPLITSLAGGLLGERVFANH